MRKACFLVQSVLAIALMAMLWKLAQTPRAPVEVERSSSTRLAWVDRSGAVLESIDLHGRYVQPRPSHDGRGVLITRVAPGRADLWNITMDSHTARRLTASGNRSAFGVWAPGGDSYFFSFAGQLLRKTGTSAPTRLFLRKSSDPNWGEISVYPDDESSDGRWILYTVKYGSYANRAYLARIETGEIVRMLDTSAHVSEARFSRDTKWIALTSNFSGRDEVYLAPVPRDPGNGPLSERDMIRVSGHGGYSPEWGANGELLYIAPSGDLMSAVWDGVAPGPARKVFRIVSVGLPDYEYRFDGYGVDCDGRRFLIGLGKRK